jgi:hypothetical protein
LGLIVAALLAVLATPAHAGWRIDRAKLIAQIVWHNPCASGVHVTWQAIPGDDGDGLAAASPDLCQIIVARHAPWPVFCTTMIHEYGHLAGFRDPANTLDPEHSTNPRSVMYANHVFARASIHKHGRTVIAWDTDRRCDHRGRDFLAQHQDPDMRSVFVTTM